LGPKYVNKNNLHLFETTLILSFKVQQQQQQQPNQPNLNQVISQHQQKPNQFTAQPHLPPLVSVNTIAAPPSPMPRVQTIQLTPQKQQLLKSIQNQIGQLSSKIQNKNLLGTLTIPSDFDANNPIHKTPLPVLNNINNMSDSDIYVALQRLFIEQQKILATGKIIPTLSAGPAFTASPQPPVAPISATPPLQMQATMQHSPAVAACISNSQQPAALSPLSANGSVVTAQFLAAAAAAGGFHHQTVGSAAVPSPIQMISPQLRQELVMSPLLVSAATPGSNNSHLQPSPAGGLQISPISSASSGCAAMPQHKVSPLSMVPSVGQQQYAQQQQLMEATIPTSGAFDTLKSTVNSTQVSVVPTPVTTTAATAMLSPIIKVPRSSL
jgi:hypothetical protein